MPCSRPANWRRLELPAYEVSSISRTRRGTRPAWQRDGMDRRMSARAPRRRLEESMRKSTTGHFEGARSGRLSPPQPFSSHRVSRSGGVKPMRHFSLEVFRRTPEEWDLRLLGPEGKLVEQRTLPRSAIDDLITAAEDACFGPDPEIGRAHV